jgi:hypothetical protein
MKTTIKLFVTYTKRDYQKKPDIGLTCYDPRSNPEIFTDTVVVRTMDIEVDVPDDFDPRPDLIKGLKEQEKKARADFEHRVTGIREQISKLQALEFTGAA